ncbi:MAG: hypothetical protein LBI34_00330, partial [Puniceicoccales bacterium]|nr:hypothetical protein [Puniceicoccales bacterium]
MVDMIESMGLNWRMPLLAEAMNVGELEQKLIENSAKTNGGGLTAEIQADSPRMQMSRIVSRKNCVPQRRKAPEEFLRASSPELESQICALVAGQIDELPNPPPGKRRAVLVAPLFAGEQRFCLQLGDMLTNFDYEYCVCSKGIALLAEKMNADLFISSA